MIPKIPLVHARFLCLLLPLAFASSIAAQAIDPAFYPIITSSNRSGTVHTSRVQADGKLLIGGAFDNANNFPHTGIARLLSDGRTDMSFRPPVLGTVLDIALQPDGKIVVAGAWQAVDGYPYQCIVRLNEDGSLDPTFVPPNFGVNSRSNFVYSIAIQPDGKILVAGTFVQVASIIRLNTDGSLDASFRPTLPAQTSNHAELLLQPDGRILISYDVNEDGTNKTKLFRLFSNGAPDPDFVQATALGTGSIAGGSPTIDSMLLQDDGKVLIGGSLNSINGVARTGLGRLNNDGTLDATLNPSIDGAVITLAKYTDNSFLIGGTFAKINGQAQGQIARLTSTGALDPSLADTFEDPFASVNTILPLSDGKLITGGNFLKVDGRLRYAVARLEPSGALDPGFEFVLIANPGTPNIIVPRADSQIFISGQFSGVNGETRRRIALLNSDGSLVSTFKDLGFGDNFTISDIIPMPDGKFLIGGSLFAFGPAGERYSDLIRYNPDGSLDTTFLTEFQTNWSVNSVNALARQPDGKILVGGYFTASNSGFRKHIVRLNADGSVDSSFLNNMEGGNNSVDEIVLQPDGKLLIGGHFTAVNGVPRSHIARLNSDGSVDTSFQNGMAGVSLGTSQFADVNLIKVDQAGRILIAGNFDSVNGSPRKYFARLNPDGSLDPTFLNGLSGPDASVSGIEFGPNGLLIVGGSFKVFNGQQKQAIVGLDSSGTIDPSFTLSFGSSNTFVSALGRDRLGNIFVAGNFGRVNEFSRAGLLKLNLFRSSPRPFDFDGDGKADLAVRRPSDNIWYFLRSTAGYTGFQYGVSGDLLTPADFDGDGKTDVAVFRPSEGQWYVAGSSVGFFVVPWGQAGDIPVPADYDGDGRADIAIYRPSNGTWYRKLSGDNSISVVQFGTAEDKPQIGDFDGDGKADLAVYRPSNNTWYFLKTTRGFNGFTWGEAGDIAAPGDYDGDGATDAAVFRPSTGVWYIAGSTAGFSTRNWGATGDIPVAADYDGDGKTDPAVFRPSNNTWYLFTSSSGIVQYQFGASNDVPVASAFAN